jgi:O-antigen ligase
MSIKRSKAEDQKPLRNSGGKSNRLELPSLRNLGGKEAAPEPARARDMSFPATVEPIELHPVAQPEEFRYEELEDRDARKKTIKKEKRKERDRLLLRRDQWATHGGHSWTYFVLFLFSAMVLFRPYELVPGLGFLSGTAFLFAIATLAIFLPSQIAVEGNPTVFTTEVKAILAMTLLALISIPIAKDSDLAWNRFNDPYIKAVVIFIVLVNVVRTRRRLMQMMWLSLGIGIYLSFSAINLYLEGKFSVESYRVAVDVGGMFGNPNEMAMHFVMMTPLVVALAIAADSKFKRIMYFAIGVLLVAANMVTYSRGGFLGLLACLGVLAWKLGRKHRLKVSIISLLVGGIAIIAAPGNYGLRMLSIFIPGLDAVGSSDQRKELLQRSLWVTARNPWGIGIGNFPIVGVHNLQTHNAFTQVSSEIGVLGLAAYLTFMISPFRKLSAIERTLFEADNLNWFYYVSIGLQASIIGYMVSSFFASVAYNWFIYYLIAYAVAFRRIYRLENEVKEDVKAEPLWEQQPLPAT